MFRNLPKVTKNLLIINTIIWFAAFLMNRMGNDTLMTIEFDTAGQKKLMANFAKLTKL